MQTFGHAGGSITTFGVAIALAAILAACGNGNSVSVPSSDVRVEVSMVGFDQPDEAFVRLDDRPGKRMLQIAIGADEARGIALELHSIKSPRPLTNELLGQVIASTGNTVDRVEVAEVRDEIYYAKIILDGGRYAIDSRPSDAIALALRVQAPIYVADTLMQSTQASGPRVVPMPVTASKFGVTVQELTPDLALYFGVRTGSGVVIADFEPKIRNAGLRRGDILVDAGGHPLRTPTDFLDTASPLGAPITLTIRRGRVTRTISFMPAAASGVVQ